MRSVSGWKLEFWEGAWVTRVNAAAFGDHKTLIHMALRKVLDGGGARSR